MPIYEYKCECSPDSIVPKERSINSIEPNYLYTMDHLELSLTVLAFIKQTILNSSMI